MTPKNNRRRNMNRNQRKHAIEKVLTRAFYERKPLSMGQIADRLEISRSTWLLHLLEDMALEGRIHVTTIPHKTGVSNFTQKFTVGQSTAAKLARQVWEEIAA